MNVRFGLWLAADGTGWIRAGGFDQGHRMYPGSFVAHVAESLALTLLSATCTIGLSS
jgi:hypothetical protein